MLEVFTIGGRVGRDIGRSSTVPRLMPGVVKNTTGGNGELPIPEFSATPSSSSFTKFSTWNVCILLSSSGRA